MNRPLLELVGLCKEYRSGDQSVAVLKDVDLTVDSGEMIAIVGASGSGKSTLMNILGCLDRPTRGWYRISGLDVDGLDADELARLRRDHFGFVFQRYHLLPDLTALGNVEMPAVYAGAERRARSDRARALLARLGLDGLCDRRPGQLSGGQQQRVSIARALMNGGLVILADEPTGALDSRSGQETLKILGELHAEGHTVVIVTHDMRVAEHAERIIEISDGEIVSVRPTRPSAGRLLVSGQTSDHTLGQSSDQTLGQLVGPASLPTPDLTLDLAPDLDQAALRDYVRDHEQRAARNQEVGHDDGPALEAEAVPAPEDRRRVWRAARDQLLEALGMALLAMAAHRLRTFLTMLGIIIGIASVVSVVALGEGSRRSILSDISSIGTNTIDVYPGKDFGDEKAQSVRTLVPADADALARQEFVDSVTPKVAGAVVLRWRNVSATAQVSGVGEQYFRVHGFEMAEGRVFDGEAARRLSQEAVIDENVRDKFFKGRGSPLGEVLLLGSVPCRIVGVAKKKQTPFGNSDSLNVWIPHTTAMSRLLGQSYLKSVTVRVSDGADAQAAEQGVVTLLMRLHGRKDFFVMNTDAIRKTIESATATMTLLVSAIALISLVVGGIGVMNIMLVSVTERTGEIGVRMAVGARQGDVMRQFLVEAVLVCLIGGTLGVALALGVGAVFARFGGGFKMVYSTASIVAAFACSTLIGVVFGYLPARNAARLDPVEALARE